MKNRNLTSLLATAFSLLQLEAASAQEQGKTEQNTAELLKITTNGCEPGNCPSSAKEKEEVAPLTPKGSSERIQTPITD